MSRLRLFQIAIATAIVAFFVIRSDPAELWEVLGDVDVKPVVVSFFLNIPIVLLTPLRSSLVFRRLGHDVPLNVLIPTTIVGFVAGGVTPAASGELLRAATLRNRANVPFEDSMVAVVYERVLALYLLALTTVLIFGLSKLTLSWQIAALLGSVFLAALPWVVAMEAPRSHRLASLANGANVLSSILRRGLAMAGQLRFLLEDPLLLLRWLSITSTMFALIALQYWLLARSVADDVSLADAWIAFGVSTLAAVLTLIPLGLGVLDGSLAAALDHFGASLEQGEIVALLVRATVTLPPILIAFACYLYLQRGGATARPAHPDSS